MIVALYFLAFALLAVPLLVMLPLNLKMNKEPTIKVYAKDLIEEFKRFEKVLREFKKATIGSVEVVIDEKDAKYMYVNGKRMLLTIDNYIDHVIN